MCQNPERSQPRLSHVPIGHVYYHRCLWDFSVPIYSVAIDLFGYCEEESVSVLVEHVSIMDDGFCNGFNVSARAPERRVRSPAGVSAHRSTGGPRARKPSLDSSLTNNFECIFFITPKDVFSQQLIIRTLICSSVFTADLLNKACLVTAEDLMDVIETMRARERARVRSALARFLLQD